MSAIQSVLEQVRMTVPSRRLRLEVLSSSGNGWGGAQLTLTAPSADGSAGSRVLAPQLLLERTRASMSPARPPVRPPVRPPGKRPPGKL